jgi:hypothetical protein
MCQVQCQGFALSFVIIMSCELLAFGTVDMVNTGCDKAHIKAESLSWLLSFQDLMAKSQRTDHSRRYRSKQASRFTILCTGWAHMTDAS